jgi:tetratricopeptide (TPR) repeat protein
MLKKTAPKKFTQRQKSGAGLIKKYSRKITESLPQTPAVENNSSHKLALPSFFTKEASIKTASILTQVKKELTVFSMSFLSVCLVFLLLIAFWFFNMYSDARAERLAAQDNYSYWNEVAVKQSNSPDAYYQAAVYAVALGKNQQASELLQKALELDPGFKKASQLRKAIVQ